MPRDRGLSRYGADLPQVDEFVSLGEGQTPLIHLPALARKVGVSGIAAKMESLNPTGSYKDRVAAMSMSLALSGGFRGWIATSSGNAGMSFAAYGARAQLPGFLCVIATAPLEKRLPILPFGPQIALVDGLGRGASRAAGTALMNEVRESAARHSLFLGTTANLFNPDGMRGIDTIGYELAEQIPTLTHLYVPTGGGGLLASVARGLSQRGLSPKIIACQPSGCAPIARHLAGELAEIAVETCDTGISALQLPDPPDGRLAVDAVSASAGWGSAISDADILSSQRLLASTEGVFVEPASAVAVASLIDDVKRGRLGAADHPVLLLSGAGWKDLGRFASDADRLSAADLAQTAAKIDRWAASL